MGLVILLLFSRTIDVEGPFNLSSDGDVDYVVRPVQMLNPLLTHVHYCS